MTIKPILLQLRARESLLAKGDDDRQMPIVEVLSHGKVLGQLPATKAVYEMSPNGIGHLTVTVFVQQAEVSGRE